MRLTRTLGGSGAPGVVFGFDAADRLISESRTIGGGGTAVNTAFSYDDAGRLTTLIHSVAGGSVLATYGYVYDNASRLTNETNAEGLTSYSYDNTNQLTGADRAGTSNDESYGYDANGNRNTTGYTTASDNRMTASPGYTYTYDSGGNTSAKTETATGNVTTYSYDHRNRLTGVTEKDNKGAVVMQATYTYDALNHRIKTEVDADGAGAGTPVVTWTAYDGMNPYADFDGSGTLATRYLYGPAVDELFARTSSGGTSAWYLTDHLGSVRDIANTSGTVIDHVAYNSFGVIIIETSPTNGDGFKYTSKPYDPNAKLQYNINRYYDAVTGKWTQEDPIAYMAGDSNLYRYVGNNPLNAIDPTGNSEQQPRQQQPRPRTDPLEDSAEFYWRFRLIREAQLKLLEELQAKHREVEKKFAEAYSKFINEKDQNLKKAYGDLMKRRQEWINAIEKRIGTEEQLRNLALAYENYWHFIWLGIYLGRNPNARIRIGIPPRPRNMER